MGARRRVVITGTAISSPAGHTLAENQAAWREGKSFFSELVMAHATHTPVRYGGACPAPDVKKLPDRKVQKVLRRKDVISLLSILDAAKHANLVKGQFDPDRVAMYVGASSTQAADLEGYVPLIQSCIEAGTWNFDAAAFGVKLMTDVNPLIMLQNLMNNSLCFGTMTLDIRGVNANFMDFQISGLRAIGEGFRSIVSGRADAAIAGGVATQVDPSQVMEGVDSGYLARTRLLPDPSGEVVRPYDRNRVGTILSEGAAYVVLEEEQHALRRGARILGRVEGFAVNSDGATNFGEPHVSKGLSLALASATGEAGIPPDQLGFVVGHGSGSLYADGAEAQAYAAVLGKGAASIPVTSPKGALGDLCEAGGVLSLMLALDVYAGHPVPPTHNFKSGDEHSKNLLIRAEPQSAPRSHAAVTARNFLGTSAVLIVSKP